MTTVSADKFLKGGKTSLVQPASEHLKEVTSEPGGIGGFGIGLVKGAVDTTVKTAQSLQKLGQGAIAAVTPMSFDEVKAKTGFKSLQDEGAKTVDDILTSKNTAQKAGKVTETIAEFLLPFLKTEKAINAGIKVAETASEIAGKTSTIASKAPKVVAKAVLGEADTQIVKSGQNPMVQLFKSGAKRVSDVVGGIEKNIQKFEATSKAALQAVKDAIPEIQLAPQKIAERVNQGIMNSIQHSADYKGVRQGFETVDDIINSGILKPEESSRIQKVVEFVGKWKDTSARGALNLKEALSNFYATGENYTGSNAVIRSIQRNLVDLVAETAPEIKGALKTASNNIDKTEQFVEHLMGKDPISGESKILTLARNLADKAKNGVKIDLVKELEKVSGSKIMNDLQGVYDYLQSSKLKAPGLQAPLETIKYGIKKAIQKTIDLSGGKATVGTTLGGAGAASALVAGRTGNTTTYTAPVEAKKKDEITLDKSKIGNTLIQLESSGGTNKASADQGEMKWLTGLTDVAIKELKRLKLIGSDFNKNLKEDVVDASVKYFNLMQKKHPNLSPGEVYVDHYWTQSASPAQRKKKIDEFNKMVGFTND